MDQKPAWWMGRPPDDMTGFKKANRLNVERSMARLLRTVAPHAQDGLEMVNTPTQAQRQLFSKNA
jgi:hypothetical protein